MERRGEKREPGRWRERERVRMVNGCVRCTLFPSPMSEPRLGYFRDISPESGVERKGQKERRERKRECVRTLVVEIVSSIYFERRLEFLAFARGQ